MKHITRKNGDEAFTLIEIMVAIVIVSIVATVVIVSMQGYGEKARTSRALAQASSAIPAMVSCWGNGFDVKTTTSGGGAICRISGGADVSGYGYWPNMPSGYLYNGVPTTKVSSWSFSVTGGTRAICCNSRMNSCGQPASCSPSAVW